MFTRSSGSGAATAPALTLPDYSSSARRSYAFEQITRRLSEQEAQHVLDFAGAHQPNIDFFLEIGHRLYSEDLLRSIDSFFTADEIDQRIITPQRIETFLDQSLEFPDQSTDVALCWDILQFIPTALAGAIVDRLYRILAPDAYLLAYFHPEVGPTIGYSHVCRIVDKKTLLMRPRGNRRALQPFNNRSIEKLFQKFRTVRFFLTRDHLREIIVQR